MRRREVLTITGTAAISGGATVYGGVQQSQKVNNDATTTDGRTDQTTDTEPEIQHSVPDPSEGMVIFTYDDSPIEDYTLTYRVHQEYDVPGCIAACPGLMQESDAFLDPGQLREMYQDGWDVLSHTYRHRVLGRVPLTDAAGTGDERLYVDTHRHGAIKGDPLIVFDEETSTSVAVAGKGSDSHGKYLKLAEPLDSAIDASGYVRHPTPFLCDILAATDARLDSWGIDVTGFVYTYGRYHGTIEEVVRERYDAVANHRYGGGHNELEGLDPTTMQRMYIETDKATKNEIDMFMDTAASDDSVLSVVGGHSQFKTLTEQRLRYTIEAALERDLAVVTLSDALAALESHTR